MTQTENNMKNLATNMIKDIAKKRLMNWIRKVNLMSISH